MIHIILVRLLNRSIIVLAVAISVPICVEAAAAVGRNEWLKGGECFGMPVIVGSTKEIKVIDFASCVSFCGNQLRNECLSEFGGGGQEVGSVILALGKSIGEVGDNGGTGGDKSNLGHFYDILCWFAYIVGTCWLAGCFQFGGRRGGDHVKPNVVANRHFAAGRVWAKIL